MGDYMRRTAALLSTVLVSSLLILVAPTAHADGEPRVTVNNGVIHGNCRYHPFTYSIPQSMAAYDWSLEVRVYDRRGVEATSGWVWKDEGYGASGTVRGDDALFFCGGDEAGRYTIKAELNFYGGPYNDIRFAAPAFRMRKAFSRTTLKVSDLTANYGQRLTFRIRSTVEFPRGFFANKYEPVVLQRRTPSGWRRMGRDWTNNRGNAVIIRRWRYRAPVRVRAVTRRTSDYQASRSPIRKVR